MTDLPSAEPEGSAARPPFPSLVQGLLLLLLTGAIWLMAAGIFLLIEKITGGGAHVPPMLTMALLNSIAFGSTCFLGLVLARRSPKTVFPMGRFPTATILPMGVLSVGLILGMNGLLEYVLSLGGDQLDAHFADLVEQMNALIRENPFASFLTVVIVAPITEELFFRGLLLQGFLKRYSTTTAVVGSTLLFSAAHLNPVQIPATIILGVYLSWLTIKSRSLIPAMLAHAFNNAIGLSLIFFGPQDKALGESVFPWWFAVVGLIGAAVAFVVIMFVFRQSREHAPDASVQTPTV